MKFLIAPLTALTLFFSASAFAQTATPTEGQIEYCETMASIALYFANQRDEGVSKQLAIKNLADATPSLEELFTDIAGMMYDPELKSATPKQLADVTYQACIQGL